VLTSVSNIEVADDVYRLLERDDSIEYRRQHLEEGCMDARQPRSVNHDYDSGEMIRSDSDADEVERRWCIAAHSNDRQVDA
jgi:hypothetical protein